MDRSAGGKYVYWVIMVLAEMAMPCVSYDDEYDTRAMRWYVWYALRIALVRSILLPSTALGPLRALTMRLLDAARRLLSDAATQC